MQTELKASGPEESLGHHWTSLTHLSLTVQMKNMTKTCRCITLVLASANCTKTDTLPNVCDTRQYRHNTLNAHTQLPRAYLS